MNDAYLRDTLESYRGCDFRALSEREEVEALVSDYLQAPSLHMPSHTQRLLFFLFDSEFKPFTRETFYGSARGGKWSMAFIAVSLILTIYVAISLARSATTWGVAFAIGLGGFIVYVTWNQVKLYWLWKDVNWHIVRELTSGHYDPVAMSDRIRHYETMRDLRVHSNVYALLRLLQRQLEQSRKRTKEAPQFGEADYE